jgi:hypothetical protein
VFSSSVSSHCCTSVGTGCPCSKGFEWITDRAAGTSAKPKEGGDLFAPPGSTQNVVCWRFWTIWKQECCIMCTLLPTS